MIRSSELFVFRPLAAADLPMLLQWLTRPHVARWWCVDNEPPTLAALEREYLPRMVPDSLVKPYVVEVSGQAIGFIQSYVARGAVDGWWKDETDPGVHGIDQFLADGDRLDQGMGTAMVSAFVQRLFMNPAVTKVQTDPAPLNARAIRCYEKVGFAKVGIVTTPDGPAMLMAATRDSTRSAYGAR